MSLNCGIVGLPNVGKSTLFNALTSTQNAQSANYPFCTIDPNKGIVDVPDTRLEKISNITKSKTILPAKLEFVDIAGLVKGASKGEGLGNQFLGNIRQVNTIIHVLRCFDSDDIIHVEGTTDPIRDADIVNSELIISDLESLKKRLPALEKKAKINDKLAKQQVDLINKIIPVLEDLKPVRSITFSKDEDLIVKQLYLLTYIPIMYVCNVDEKDMHNGNDHTKAVSKIAEKENAEMIIICAKLEQEISTLDNNDEKAEFLESMGLQETGLDKIINVAYNLLGLQTFFTSGPKETRAWTVTKGSLAPEAAGEIHSDFERGFICAETIAYEDFIRYNGESGAKENGKIRQEGKTYIVKDGDIILFRYNV